MSPLLDKSILITRGKKQAKEFSTKIIELGGKPIEVPLISFQYPSNFINIDYAFKNMNEYDWIVFTSKNGVDYFFNLLEKYNISTSILHSKKIAVVGKKTAKALENKGYFDVVIPTNFVAESLIDELKGMIKVGDSFLLARGNLARSILPNELLNMGCKVMDLVVYETVINETSKNELISLLEEKKIDIITFSSPSAVENFVSLLNGTNFLDWIQNCMIACIGPITKQKALINQIPVHICPKEYTIDGMIQSVISYLKEF